MKHTSVVLRRDLAIGTFFTQISITFNKVFYSFFAALLAYYEWSSLFNSFGLIEVLFFIYLFFFYLMLILFFVASFGVVIALFGSVFKKGVLGIHDFEFSDDEFIESTEYNKSHCKYSAISNVFTRLGAIYIAIPGAQWHILPKRDFENTQKRDELLNYLKEARKYEKGA